MADSAARHDPTPSFKPWHKSVALVVHGIGEQPKGSTLKQVVEGFQPFIRERVDPEVVVSVKPLDALGPAELTFEFESAAKRYELRFVEVWWAQAFVAPALGPLIVGSLAAFRQAFRRRGEPASNALTFFSRLLGEAISTVIFNLLAVLVAAALLLPTLVLSFFALLFYRTSLWTPLIASIHGVLLARVAKHQPLIVETFLIVLSPALLLALLVLWLIETLVPKAALKSPIKEIKSTLVNTLTRHFGDMWVYLYQPWEASRIRRRFEEDVKREVQAIKEQSPWLESVMVIAHSMGTVVAYEALTGNELSPLLEKTFGDEGQPSFHFVSIGSALNLSWASVPDAYEFRFWQRLPPGVNWLNIWSEYDPVAGEPLHPPGQAWSARKLSSLPEYEVPLEQRQAVNQMDLFSDHSAYWNNAEEVLTPILDRLTGHSLDLRMNVPARRHRVRILAAFKAAAWLVWPAAFFVARWSFLRKAVKSAWEGVPWLKDASDWLIDKIPKLLPEDAKKAVDWVWDQLLAVVDRPFIEAAAAALIAVFVYSTLVKALWNAWDNARKYRKPDDTEVVVNPSLGPAPELKPNYTTVIIGSGFGGTMTGLTLADAYKQRNHAEDILILERGTWWTTPVGTVQDKEVRAYDRLQERQEPVQFWSSAENFKGLIDIATRCIRRKGNEDGLYDLTNFGKKGFLGLFGNKNDGVSVLRASGVGGGSLVYANVTIEPPSFIFDEEWPAEWQGDGNSARERYYAMARNAIGLGVLHAVDIDRNVQRLAAGTPSAPVHDPINTGLSNIAAHTARLNPHWHLDATGNLPTDGNGIPIKQINLAKMPGAPDPNNALWIDRARVFQTAMAQNGFADEYGTVYSSINDLASEPDPYNPGEKPKNYCERQGRCLIGCLPGARHTLNKQLMSAALVNPRDPTLEPEYWNVLKVQALAEVDYIRALPGDDAGYQVHYVLRDPKKPWRKEKRVVTAKNVIVAAGCIGTNEIMLRSKARDRLPGLSDKVGDGFSTNGDLLAFLPRTKEKIYLTKGPITTSYGHFNSSEGANHKHFFTIEDNGIPRALASLASFGVLTLQGITLSHGNRSGIFLVASLVPKFIKRGWQILRAPFINDQRRQDTLISEDEMLANMMCIAAIGRSAADAKFSLGRGRGETTLRVKRPQGQAFKDDPIYKEIDDALTEFGRKLSNDPDPKWTTPWQTNVAEALDFAPTALSHPLGGCRMADSIDKGVCDAYGRVYERTADGNTSHYKGLYISDAALLPASLGVNPSLTISAVALRAVQAWLEKGEI